MLRLTSAALLAACLLPASAAQPPSAPPTLADASARLQAQDAAGAAALLQTIVKAEPKNGRAWRLLGSAYQQLKKFDEAIAANRTALDVDPDMPAPLYAIGASYARLGRTDEAFEWLARARASRRIDMTQAQVDTDLAALRSDARFAALLPTPKDFADPFVEPVTILREWDGEAANDQFGWIARNIGDVDGDGVADLVTSAPTSGAAGTSAGRVYVYSTKSGRLLWKADGEAGAQLGSGIEAAGDTNKDGIPDVIASGPGNGKAFVYSGRDGRVLLTLTGEHAGDRFGAAVTGYADGRHQFIVVGAPGAGPAKHGRAFVYTSLSGKPAFVVDADETGNALAGMFVSVPGDVDADGVPDVYVSDWSNRAKGQATGRVYVHSGRDGHRLLTLTGDTAGEGFGTSASVAGDVDGDGHADLIVGAWQYAGAALSGGRAYLYSGRDGRLLKTFTCRTPGDTFGFDAVDLGDVDGDGTIDFLITSGWSGVHGFHSGRVFIVSSGVKRPA